MIRTGCQAKLAAWFNMDTEMQVCARAAMDRQIATRPDSSSLFGSLAQGWDAGVSGLGISAGDVKRHGHGLAG